MSDGLPIIRLEVESMKRTIRVALTDYMVRMDQDVKQAIEDICTPEYVQGVLRDAVRNALAVGIREEVTNFFNYGEGRKIVAAAVRQKLLSEFTDTPLDGAG